tara:strand:- start:1100 stop:1348 length:249 start_codon:yes stop_codon:yes gene_type:complete
MKKKISDLDKKTIFGEPISCVKAILIGNQWYKSDIKNPLETETDHYNNKTYFYFWMNDENSIISNSSRISGNIETIQAVAVD